MKKQYKTHLLICSERQHEKDLSHYPFRSAGVVSPSYAGTAGRQWKAVSGTCGSKNPAPTGLTFPRQLRNVLCDQSAAQHHMPVRDAPGKLPVRDTEVCLAFPFQSKSLQKFDLVSL